MFKSKNFQNFKNIYQNKNTGIIINLICIFILVKLVISILITIKGVIIYDFYHHFDYEYQKKIFNNNLYTHTILLYIPIFLSFIAIIKRKVGMLEFVIAFVLSSLAIKYNWFDIIHNNIKNTFIFDKLRESGRTVINDQYTRIIIYVLLIITLLIQVMLKKTRTLSRIMILFMTTSCLLTVIIFHIAIPMGIFKSVLEEKTQSQKYEMENYSREDICKRKNCYFLLENGKIEVISEVSKLENFKQYERVISNGIYIINNTEQKVFADHLNVNAGFLFDYDIIVMKKEKDKYFTTIDNISIRQYSRESEIMFSFLAIMAHFIWIFGTMVLLEFHYYKFKKRLIMKKEEVKL